MSFEFDHEDKALAALPSRFRNATNVRAIVRAAARRCQIIEDDMEALIEGSPIARSTGHDLRVWGRIVGETQSGLPESVYRGLVQARAMANYSNTTPEHLMAIGRAGGGDATARWSLTGVGAAAVVVFRGAPMSDTHAKKLKAILCVAFPADGNCTVGEANSTSYFGWQGDPNAKGWNEGAFAWAVD